MKKICFIVFLCGCFLQSIAQNREIDFGQTTLEEALERASKSNKLVFVDCYTTYCPPCRTMAATVFKTDSVADFFNATFENVKMNMDEKENKVYMERYLVGAFPSFLLLNAKGELLYKFVGGMPADKFMEHIRLGMNPDNEVVRMNMTYSSGKYDDEFMRDYIRLKLKLLEKAEALRLTKMYLESLSPRERASKENWFVFEDRTLCEVNNPNMHYLFEHWRDFVKQNGEKVVFDRIAYLCRWMSEWELHDWKYEKSDEDFEFYKRYLSEMNIPDQQDYLRMMEINRANARGDKDEARKLLVEYVPDFTVENQHILFAGMDLFPYSSRVKGSQFYELAKKILLKGKNTRLTNFLETLVDAEEIYGGEKYDVQALRTKVGTTTIIPFFHPTKDMFWYVFEDADGGKQYYAYDRKRGKRALYDTLAIDRCLQKMGEKINHRMVFYTPEFSKDEILPVVSMGGKDYLFDAKKQVLTPYTSGKKYSMRPFGYSPDTCYEVHMQDHNLWIKNRVTGEDKQLTFDGEEDWAYVVADMQWMGTDGDFYITREDSRNIREFSVLYTCTFNGPSVQTYKYELPGDKQVKTQSLYVGQVKNGKLIKVPVEKWPGQLLQILKTPDVKDRVFFIRKKRTRDEFELCSADVKTGEVKVILHEVSKPYINPDLFSCHVINKGQDILLWSDRSGWGHYYHYDADGQLKNAVTTGNWTAGKVVKIDTLKREMYLYGYGKEEGRNPNYAYLYKVNFDGSRLSRLTPENATHHVFISPSGNLLVDNFSRIDTIPQVSVRDRNGKLLKILEKPDISKLLDYGWCFPEQFTVKAADGKTDLYGIMWKPFDFDSTKVYPIISQVYPGPFTETVWTEFTVFDRYNNTALAQRGFIVVCMGHRGGSPYRDKAYAMYGYGNLRDYPLADDVCGIRQLGRRFSYIDTTRVGIFGHSGGGMMAAAAICTYPDFYKVAVSSAGNHDNRIYNRNWGETYQGIGDDNRFQVDVNQDLVKNLKGHLLLVTGEVDQNVHPANTMRMVNALILNNKDFDLLILPNQSHHYEGAYQTYFEKKKRDYFSRYLLKEDGVR